MEGFSAGVASGRGGGDSADMDRDYVLSVLEAHRPELERRFGVVSLDLFGSFARNCAREDSDIDLLVRFEGPTCLSREAEMQDYLEGLLGRPVDLVPAERLRPEYRAYVEKDIAMDDSERPAKDWRIPVRDMIGFGERVLAETAGMELEQFLGSNPIYDMAQFNIVRIGEAAGRIPQEIRDVHPEIEWQRIRDARNVIMHEYNDVDGNIVWNIVRMHIPALLPQLRALLEAEDETGA